jgi:hypothetical protein
MLRRLVLSLLCGAIALPCFCWGFFAHKQINYFAVFLLPPGMMPLYKQEIGFLTEHAVDPDKRRYAVAEEGPRHFIDLDRYGQHPYAGLPRNWDSAVQCFGQDSLLKGGIAPWWIPRMVKRLTRAFESGNRSLILKTSADLGHYIADMHVPLHASSNHNGQLTNQHGIHGFWESRIPELFARDSFDFLVGRARYLPDVSGFIWARALESAAAADTVLRMERNLSAAFSPDKKYAFEYRNQQLVRQYARAYAQRYHQMLNGMVERRMRESIFAVASCWYTAWVDAGQPDLRRLPAEGFSAQDSVEWKLMQEVWMQDRWKGRSCDQ